MELILVKAFKRSKKTTILLHLVCMLPTRTRAVFEVKYGTSDRCHADTNEGRPTKVAATTCN